MKQQVDDINSALTGLLSELHSLRKTVGSLYAGNRSLNRNVYKLLKENRELRKRLEKYEKLSKDSGNSSTPPSKEPVTSLPNPPMVVFKTAYAEYVRVSDDAPRR